MDLIATDLPYGTTQCRWDTVIPLDEMWSEFRRVLQPEGAVVLTANQPFTSKLVLSNPKDFRFEDVWDKVATTGFLDCNRRPLRRHESVLLFSRVGSFTYNPQKGVGPKYYSSGNRPVKTEVYGNFHDQENHNDGTRFPTSIIEVPNFNGTGSKVHPTQKPVALFEYLIRTYSNSCETVLDCTMGSGTTGVACINTDRRFIGIERDPTYFEIATQRIADARLLVDRPHAPTVMRSRSSRRGIQAGQSSFGWAD